MTFTVGALVIVIAILAAAVVALLVQRTRRHGAERALRQSEERFRLMEFAYDGGGPGKGGNVTLYCAGKAVGKGRVDQTQGFVFSADETTDIGYESGTSVSPDYDAHSSRFNGKINWVQIDLDKDAQDADHYISPDERLRIAMARQ